MNISQEREPDRSANWRRTGGLRLASGAFFLSVGLEEPGRPRRSHKPETAGSNPATATSFVCAPSCGPP